MCACNLHQIADEIIGKIKIQYPFIREVIISGLGIMPVRNRYKIFIIDEVHQLSGPSFNSLLKSIEEPPPHVVFMMATTELDKIPETVLSRAQVYEFRTISTKVIATQLAEIGIRLDVLTQESNTFYDQTWLKAPLYTVSWGTNDSALFLASKLMTSGSNRNETDFKDAEFDSVTAKALAASSDSDYARACRDVQRIEYDRGGYLVWGMADGIDIATSLVRDLPTLGGFARVQLERAWLAQ